MIKKVMVITGEMSGDIHAAGLLRELQLLHPDLEITGTGGAALKKIGAKLLFNIDDMAIFGLGEIFKKYRFLRHIMRTLKEKLDNSPPDLVITVDYGGFNLRFIPFVKARNIPVIYYISPQVWVSRQNRVKKIKKYTDALIAILPFEPDFYRRFDVNIHYFGHPLADSVRKTLSRNETAIKYELDENKPWIVFLPGSRRNEISKNLSIIEGAVERIRADYPNVEFVCCISSNFEKFGFNVDSLKTHVRFLKEDMYNIVGNADFAAVCSGTASLEAALLEVPMVIFYRPDYLAFFISYYFFKIRTVGLPNIISGKKYVEEFIEYNLPDKRSIAEYVSERAIKQLKYPETADNYRKEAKKLKNMLRGEGAYKKSAQFISDFAKQRISK